MLKFVKQTFVKEKLYAKAYYNTADYLDYKISWEETVRKGNIVNLLMIGYLGAY